MEASIRSKGGRTDGGGSRDLATKTTTKSIFGSPRKREKERKGDCAVIERGERFVFLSAQTTTIE